MAELTAEPDSTGGEYQKKKNTKIMEKLERILTLQTYLIMFKTEHR
jgi:hypothetical protein